jgi:hypothetical protein
MSNFIASIVAVGLLYIAWQNWRTNHKKLNLDLFEKKYIVYEAVERFIVHVNSAKGDVDRNELGRLIVSTTSAKFLFGKDVTDFLNHLGSSGRKMQKEDKEHHLDWVLDMSQMAADIFGPYMDIRKL